MKTRVLLTVLAILLCVAPSLSAEEPPGGPADCSKWPRNLDSACVGFALLFQELAGEARPRNCDTSPDAEHVALQIWDRFSGRATADALCDKLMVNDQSVGLTSPEGVAAITATLQVIYSNTCSEWMRLNGRRLPQAGCELGTRIECDKLPFNKWTAIGLAGIRTYSDQTEGVSLHAVNVCRAKDGTIWVFDSNDSDYHRCIYDAQGLAWTSFYTKPGRPMGQATQRYTVVVDLRSVLIELDKAVR
jgi:hypothetical protein